MKTKTYSTLLMVVFIFGLIACDKDQPSNPQSSNSYQLTPDDQKVTNRILKFRQKLAYKKAHPSYKSSELVNVDSARWDVETNFNATYAFPDENYTTTRQDSAVLILTIINDSTTLMDDVLSFNDQVFDQVLTLYNNSPLANRELLFVSLRNGEMSNSELEVKLLVVTGEMQTNTYNFTPFAVGDDWKYGDFLGKCDGNNVGTDAAEELQNLLNLYKTTYCIDMPGPPSLYRKIYSDDPLSPYLLEGDEFRNENTGEYPIYYIEKNTLLTDDDICLNYNEMNLHYNGEWAVIYDSMRVKYNRPCNWDFMLCDIQGKRVTTLPPNILDKARHYNELFYSYHHWVRRDCIPDAISLCTKK